MERKLHSLKSIQFFDVTYLFTQIATHKNKYPNAIAIKAFHKNYKRHLFTIISNHKTSKCKAIPIIEDHKISEPYPFTHYVVPKR